MVVKLQKPAPIDLVGGSQETSPAVHAPAKPKAPMRPDSVPSQYNFSLPSKSTMYSSFTAFRCGAISVFISVFLASVGMSAAVFTQHSNYFLGFVALMSPLRHHPFILKPQQSDCLFLCISKSWWYPACRKSGVHLLSFVFHIVHSVDSSSAAIVFCLSWSSKESHK
jgi:hypothetical protein